MENSVREFVDCSKFQHFIFENSSDVYWILDECNRIKFISPSIVKLTGYTAEEYIELDFTERFTNKSLDALAEFFDKVDNINEFKNLYVEYISKSGNIVYTEVSGVIFRDDAGNFKGLYGLTVNLSDKYKLLNELSYEKEKNQEAEKFKSIILGIIGHEFRTPLSGIMGFVNELSKSTKSEDEKESISYIHQSAQRLNATLNSIITLAALESNQLNIVFDEINLLEIIQNIYQSFEPIINNKNISFDINLKNKSISIVYDENCFYHILYHLIDNAIKFTEKGRVFVEVNIGENGIGKYIEIRVEDTGIGINKHKYGTIFEPFRQLSEGHDRKYEGLGIGLTTIKKLVERLKGSIVVKSKLNEGSIFTVKLPLDRTAF